MNSTHNVSHTTFEVLKSEFERGKRLLYTGKKDNKIISEAMWKELLEPKPFFSEHKHFLQIQISSPPGEISYSWRGFVEAKIRTFFLKLEQVSGIGLHPHPDAIFRTVTNEDGSVTNENYWFIGLEHNSATQYDFRSPVKGFLSTVKQHNLFVSNADVLTIGISCVKSKKLPKFIPRWKRRRKKGKKSKLKSKLKTETKVEPGENSNTEGDDTNDELNDSFTSTTSSQNSLQLLEDLDEPTKKTVKKLIKSGPKPHLRALNPVALDHQHGPPPGPPVPPGPPPILKGEEVIPVEITMIPGSPPRKRKCMDNEIDLSDTESADLSSPRKRTKVGHTDTLTGLKLTEPPTKRRKISHQHQQVQSFIDADVDVNKMWDWANQVAQWGEYDWTAIQPEFEAMVQAFIHHLSHKNDEQTRYRKLFSKWGWKNWKFTRPLKQKTFQQIADEIKEIHTNFKKPRAMSVFEKKSYVRFQKRHTYGANRDLIHATHSRRNGKRRATRKRFP